MTDTEHTISPQLSRLLMRVTEATLAIVNNPAIIMPTYMYIDKSMYDSMCEICDQRGCDLYVVHTPTGVYYYCLCNDCYYACDSIEEYHLDHELMDRRVRLLAPQFYIRYSGSSRCICCCHIDDDTYKDNSVGFLCRPCKRGGTMMLCVEVLIALTRVNTYSLTIINDVRFKIASLIWVVSMGFDND